MWWNQAVSGEGGSTSDFLALKNQISSLPPRWTGRNSAFPVGPLSCRRLVGVASSMISGASFVLLEMLRRPEYLYSRLLGSSPLRRAPQTGL